MNSDKKIIENYGTPHSCNNGNKATGMVGIMEKDKKAVENCSSCNKGYIRVSTYMNKDGVEVGNTLNMTSAEKKKLIKTNVCIKSECDDNNPCLNKGSQCISNKCVACGKSNYVKFTPGTCNISLCKQGFALKGGKCTQCQTDNVKSYKDNTCDVHVCKKDHEKVSEGAQSYCKKCETNKTHGKDHKENTCIPTKCNTGYYLKEDKCHPTKKDGESCKFNTECKSERCLGMEGKKECSSGMYQQTCDREVNDSCNVTHKSKKLYCGYENTSAKGKNTRCQFKLANKSKCNEDKECDSNSCIKGSGVNSKTSMCIATPYPGLNEFCNENNVCDASKHFCSSEGKCKAKKTDNQNCKNSNECYNGFGCLGPFGNKMCVKTTNAANGELCQEDTHCLKTSFCNKRDTKNNPKLSGFGFCKEKSKGTDGFICDPNLEDNRECAQGYWCAGKEGETSCVKHNNSKGASKGKKCTVGNANRGCNKSEENLFCQLGKSVCVGQLDNGRFCTKDSNCLSGNCIGPRGQKKCSSMGKGDNCSTIGAGLDCVNAKKHKCKIIHGGNYGMCVEKHNVGQKCSTREDCKHGLLCIGPANAKTCSDLRVGSTCNKDNGCQGDNTYCQFSAEKNTDICVGKNKVGERCEDSTQCEDNARCEGLNNKLCSSGKNGEKCTNHNSCITGHFCDKTANNICQPKKENGASCEIGWECKSNKCRGNLCTDGKIGSKCLLATDCLLPGVCNFDKEKCEKPDFYCVDGDKRERVQSDIITEFTHACKKCKPGYNLRNLAGGACDDHTKNFCICDNVSAHLCREYNKKTGKLGKSVGEPIGAKYTPVVGMKFVDEQKARNKCEKCDSGYALNTNTKMCEHCRRDKGIYSAEFTSDFVANTCIPKKCKPGYKIEGVGKNRKCVPALNICFGGAQATSLNSQNRGNSDQNNCKECSDYTIHSLIPVGNRNECVCKNEEGVKTYFSVPRFPNGNAYYKYKEGKCSKNQKTCTFDNDCENVNGEPQTCEKPLADRIIEKAAGRGRISHNCQIKECESGYVYTMNCSNEEWLKNPGACEVCKPGVGNTLSQKTDIGGGFNLSSQIPDVSVPDSTNTLPSITTPATTTPSI